MNADLDKLEREVDAALASLSGALSAPPPEALLDRVKAAARHELNEAWLADQPTPLPPPEAVHRVRGVVRDELQRSRDAVAAEGRATDVPPRRLARSRVGWSLAAAAMIGLFVGVVHYAGTWQASQVPVAPDDDSEVRLFVDAAQEIFVEDPLTASILTDLDAIEESISQWQPIQGRDVGVLRDIADEIDGLLVEPEPGDGVSRSATRKRGALG